MKLSTKRGQKKDKVAHRHLVLPEWISDNEKQLVDLYDSRGAAMLYFVAFWNTWGKFHSGIKERGKAWFDEQGIDLRGLE